MYFTADDHAIDQSEKRVLFEDVLKVQDGLFHVWVCKDRCVVCSKIYGIIESLWRPHW